MASSIATIKATMTTDFMNNETLANYYGFTVGDSFDALFSKVSVESIFFYTAAVAIWALSNLLDIFKLEITALFNLKQTHGALWYSNLGKEFQFGYELNYETGEYDVIDESAKIIAQCSVTIEDGVRTMKVARLLGGTLVPLSTSEVDAVNQFIPFIDYLEQKKDFGVTLKYVNLPGDNLRLVINVWYNPLVLNSEGKLLRSPDVEPALVTITNFIQNLKFNGEFIPVELQDKLQLTEGIEIPTILNCATKYAGNDWVTIDSKIVPKSGYLVINDVDLTINYTANV